METAEGRPAGDLEACLREFVAQAGLAELGTLAAVLGNAAREPGNPKFRRLRPDNARVGAVLRASGGRGVLRAVGFRPESEGEGCLVLPEALGADEAAALLQGAALLQSLLPEAGRAAAAAPGSGGSGPASAADAAAAAAASASTAAGPPGLSDALDRLWQVFTVPQESGLPQIEVPESFFQLTPSELQREYASRTQRGVAGRELQTGAMRAAAEARRRGKAGTVRAYRSCVVRVRLPCGRLLQGVFAPVETGAAVCAFVAAALECPATAFELFAHPGRLSLSADRGSTETLLKLGLVPAALINFKWSPGGASGALRADMAAAAVSLAGAPRWG